MSKPLLATRRPSSDFPSSEVNYGSLSEEVDELLDDAEVTPVSAFEFTCSPTWRITDRAVNDAYWSHILSGTGECWLERKSNRHRLAPGDTAWFPKGVRHGVAPDAGVAFKMINVHFHANAFGSIDVLAALGLSGPLPPTSRRLAELSMDLCREHALREPGWRRAMTAMIWEALLDAVRGNVDPSRIRVETLSRGRGFSRLKPALDHIERHFRDPDLTIDDVARRISTSETYLRRLFRQTFNESPLAFIRRRRLETACLALKETQLPIKTIAVDTGFRDAVYFHRVFKKTIGATPKEFRRRLDV